ncbi:hypothetical protein [Micromonospora endophytica]|uniref:hypothetical protein n=1 Tax=Micromonospora endophytica TaxID=515350 RepID=UPI000DA910D1|nr:hypothetical protein [Micromonospora endophytica]RIW41596.1 hypothetical protein D3H59_25655 [Micromonospora endophytica]BCJ61226.1 hypothetical protein Jiend_46480 [Micromonospora endophytica]
MRHEPDDEQKPSTPSDETPPPPVDGTPTGDPSTLSARKRPDANQRAGRSTPTNPGKTRNASRKSGATRRPNDRHPALRNQPPADDPEASGYCCEHARAADEIPLGSPQDLEDADDILVAHAPRTVSRMICGCGEDYPCSEVHFAQLVKAAVVRPTR